MALPYTIANGQAPSGTKLQLNFEYLASGKGVLVGTIATINAAIAEAPTAPLLALATYDDGHLALLFYCGDATKGDSGFASLATFGPATSTTEVG